MKALEVWINGEKKCVAGTDNQVLTVILDVIGHPQSPVAGLLNVGGLIRKGSDGFYVDWVKERLKIGDEVHIRLLETEDVDPPTAERRAETQAEKDANVRTGLLNVRAMLSDELSESDLATVGVFGQRIEEESWIVAMRVLSELGHSSVVTPSYWKDLAKVASQLQRYDESSQYRKRGDELEDGDKEQGLG